MMATTQFEVLNWKMSHLALRPSEEHYDPKEEEIIIKDRLNKCLRHYDVILRYCKEVQETTGLSLFAQYSTGAITICISLSSFLIPMTHEDFVILVCYIAGMTVEIFYPAYLGAELTEKSENLIFSVYCGDWISRPESYKRSLRLMLERANKPVVITCLKMFELSLITFTSVMKSAYSFFTLLKCLLERQQ
ncbi:unnamed protein product [Chilo suppressalis]|uniref:Odorant receptor n=1 Tax=Chilo suppressalis TaxID=168631 RepID=A0ABN8B7J0_CHISP|nr:unnamed protein product [Chilo suppressalis]